MSTVRTLSSRARSLPHVEVAGDMSLDLGVAAADLNEIETAPAAITVQGARYPEAMERLIDR